MTLAATELRIARGTIVKYLNNKKEYKNLLFLRRSNKV
jgi:hypothetical protein